jgi:hypothetical protein
LYPIATPDLPERSNGLAGWDQGKPPSGRSLATHVARGSLNILHGRTMLRP